MTTAERKSDFKLTAHTPYLALMGELWDVSSENTGKNDRVITALHYIRYLPCILQSWPGKNSPDPFSGLLETTGCIVQNVKCACVIPVMTC